MDDERVWLDVGSVLERRSDAKTYSSITSGCHHFNSVFGKGYVDN